MLPENEAHAIHLVFYREGYIHICLYATDEYIYFAMPGQFRIYIAGPAEVAIAGALYCKKYFH